MGANTVGISIQPPATTESGDLEPYKALFCREGGGYNAARGLISQNENRISNISNTFYELIKLSFDFDYSNGSSFHKLN